MRIVSVLGIICLLALQWVWWRSAFKTMESNFIAKAQDCLVRSVDKAIMHQLDSESKGIRVVNNYDKKAAKPIKMVNRPNRVTNIFDIEYTMDDCTFMIGKPVNAKLIDSSFNKSLKKEFGYIPKHTLKVNREKADFDEFKKNQFNRFVIGNKQDSIFHQFGYSAYVLVVFPTPLEFYVKQGSYIFIISIVLVILIGGIMILQFLTMRREQKFTSFIKDYTRMMTHELKTPISGFKMVIKLLQSNPDKEVADKYLAASDNLTDRVLGNLDNILYMAMSEKRELPINRSTVKIKAFLEQIADRYRAVDYNPKIITIRTKCEPEDLAWIMDAQLMERVMNNLMDNAIKYTGEDTQIDLTCTLDGECASFCVRDNGMGISEDDQKRIYDLYERGKIAYKNHYEGYGIGLNFVHRAIKAHGGKLMMKSEIDVGTAFTIKLLPYK
jgi:two-component system phosphate regulon sensor histidine kinase PhoR